MGDITEILESARQGDPTAGDELLVRVYDELRGLAARKLAREKPGQTLNATALVHEAYLRLLPANPAAGGKPDWQNRGHFFGAAAEAMRRILIERARKRAAIKHGGGAVRVTFDEAVVQAPDECDQLLAIDEALTELEKHDAQAAQLVKLRYFAGLQHQEAADALGITRRAADRVWALARTWLYQRLKAD
jgi:RNA polymerase sigma factor (TIGR02999 family)